MKTNTRMLGLAALMLVCAGRTTAVAQYPEQVRQALQQACDKAKEELSRSGMPAGQAISLLPMAGDQGRYVEGLLKNAVTAAGLMYVEGKDDPLWEEIVQEVAWDEKKADMLDEATLGKFGRLKATQILMYGAVREATATGGRVYVEIELHASSIATKQHLWGTTVSRRFYMPGEMEGLVSLDRDVRQALKKLLVQGEASIKKAPKLKTVQSVAVIPLAGDIDKYLTGLAVDMFTQAGVTPRELDISTLGEARMLLRDKPGQADALLYGAVRDLSRKLKHQELLKDTYEIDVDVQLRVEDAKSGDILWSGTLIETFQVVESQSGEQLTVGFLKKHPKVLLYGLGGLVALIVLSMFLRATRRVR